MKKLVSMLMVVTLLVVSVGTLGVFAAGDTFTVDYLNYKVNEDETTVTLAGVASGYDTSSTAYDSTNCILYIPETVTNGNVTYSINAIGTSAFQNNTTIQGVVLTDNITTLGESAFRAMSALRVVEFAENNKITVIPNACFKGSIRLGTYSTAEGKVAKQADYKLIIPEGVTTIDTEAFNANGLDAKTIIFPSTIDKITNCFGSTADTTAIEIKTIEKMSNLNDNWIRAFTNATFTVYSPEVADWLKGVRSTDDTPDYIIPEAQITFVEGTYDAGTVTVGDYSYILKTIVTRNSRSREATVKGFSEAVLEQSETGNQTVDIPASVTDSENVTYQVTALADAAFRGKTAVRYVYLPEGLTTIEANAFKGDNKLTYCYIPSTVTKVGKQAFYQAPSDTGLAAHFVIAGTTTTWESGVFTPKSDTSPGKRTFYIRDTAVQTAILSDTNNTITDGRDYFASWDKALYIPEINEFVYTATAAGTEAKAYVATYGDNDGVKELNTAAIYDVSDVKAGLNLLHNMEASADGDVVKVMVWDEDQNALADAMDITSAVIAQ